MPEHGFCPSCVTDLDGGDILQTFIAKGKTPEEASKIADLYGYRPGHTQWGRQIAIYSILQDRTIQWMCPDCGHKWSAL